MKTCKCQQSSTPGPFTFHDLDFLKSLEEMSDSASHVKAKIAKKGSKMMKRAKKAVSHLDTTLQHQGEKLHKEVQAHAESIHKKVSTFLREVDSKRLLRRILVANAWL